MNVCWFLLSVFPSLTVPSFPPLSFSRFSCCTPRQERLVAAKRFCPSATCIEQRRLSKQTCSSCHVEADASGAESSEKTSVGFIFVFAKGFPSRAETDFDANAATCISLAGCKKAPAGERASEAKTVTIVLRSDSLDSGLPVAPTGSRAASQHSDAASSRCIGKS